ncbi:DEAD/DEAH box helicase [Enterococcus cecorum]
MEINQLPETWQARWQSEKFQTPTKIQEKVFDPIKQGQSIVGVSPTGSGKTIAYLLPTMLNISANQGVQLVVITATQELAMQVTEVARPWAKDLGLKVQSLIGGANIKRQIEKLKQRPEIVVGTAGRINELNQQKKLKLHQVKTLILDEADQLLKSNQESALLSPILKAMDNQVQVLAFSASGTQLPEQFQQMYRLKLTLIDVTNEDTSKGEITHGYVIWYQNVIA